MIKKISLSVLLISSLYSSYLDDYKNNNYKSAFNKASKLCEVDCSEEQLNIVLAKSAEKLGNIKEAIAAYDRVLIINENNLDARFSIANLYYQNGNSQLMKDELSYILENYDLDQSQITRINQMINNIEQERVVSPYYASINVGFAYDSNPLYGNKKYTDFISNEEEGIENFQNEQPSGSLSLLFSADASYNIDLDKNYMLSLFASTYNKKYFKKKSENYPDLNVFSVGFSPKYFKDNKALSLTFDYDYVILKRDGFLHSLNAGISFEHDINEDYLYTLSYDYSRGIFAKSDEKDSNFNHHAIGFNNIYSYLNNIYFLTLTYDIEKAKNSLSANSDFSTYGIKIGAIFNILDNFNIRPSIAYNISKFKKIDISYLNSRKDKELVLNTIFSYRIDKSQNIDLGLMYDKQDSNHNLYDSINYSALINYRYEF